MEIATKSNSSKRKSLLNEKQKKILNIVLTVLQVIIVVLAIVFSIIILVNPSRTTISKKGTFFMPVLSNSMAGDQKDSFKAGDLVVAHAPVVGSDKWDPNNLKVGTIITYLGNVNGKKEPITHRIIEVINQSDISASTPIVYRTKGDANPTPDTIILAPKDICGIYKYHTAGAGKFILFLQTPKYFILVVILPLIALFIYNVVLFVLMVVEKKQAKLVAENSNLTTEQEEERKQQIIAEYLATQNKTSEVSDSEDSADNPSNEKVADNVDSSIDKKED